MSSTFQLRSFQLWLIRDRNRSATTAANYTSQMRAFLRDEETAKQLTDDPNRFCQYALAYDFELKDASRAPFRSALRAFIAFAAAGGRVLETPIFEDGRSKRWETEKAKARAENERLGYLLRKLEKAGIPFKRIPLLRWRDVRRGGSQDEGLLEDVLERCAYPAPLDIIKELGFWAGKGEPPGKDQPLIPIDPGGKSPMPVKRLMRIARGE